jgi:CBS domain containing-hemolysin-like protein
MKSSPLGWAFKMLLLTLGFCLFFSTLSELVLSRGGIIVASIVIFAFLLISILFDCIGVAAISADKNFFYPLIKKGERGALIGLGLARHSEKVASILCDIVGDICNILSGSAAAAITVKILASVNGNDVIITTLISSSIAAIAVFGKATGKTYAVKNANQIVLKLGKILAKFKRDKHKNKSINKRVVRKVK